MASNKCPICGSELFIIDGKQRCRNFPIKCTYQKEMNEIDLDHASYIVFDLETSGFNRTTDRIIQIAAVRVENNKIVDNFDEFVKPNTGKPIRSNITELTGITNEMLENQPDENVRVNEFIDWLKKSKFDYAVAHNGVAFDSQMLKAACRRIGVPNPIHVIIDTLTLAKTIFPKGNHEGIDNYQQKTLATHYGIEYDAHNAKNDVDALQMIYEHLLKDAKKKNISVTDLRAEI